MDIVNFTNICDAFEPSLEDELTRKIAKKIGNCFRSEESIACISRGRLVIFISELENNANDRIIIEMISGLATKMDIEVIAEGIETEGQKQFLLSVGCSLMQGYLFSPPIPAR